MEGDFAQLQPKLKPMYVMIDWDETMSLSPETFLAIFQLFKEIQLKPMVITLRSPNDSDDILSWVDKSDVIFTSGKQKKDALVEAGIKVDQVAFWIDDAPETIPSHSGIRFTHEKPKEHWFNKEDIKLHCLGIPHSQKK